MLFFSTSERKEKAALFEALFEGFAPNGHLYLPVQLPVFSSQTLSEWRQLSFQEICLRCAEKIFEKDLKTEQIETIVQKAFCYPVPLHFFEGNISLLELFHGPTLSFKDFGSGFMARLVEALWSSTKPLIVLVATTGDTGSAVGKAFQGIHNVKVCILYPKGKVTAAQEQQLTTLQGNTIALEIDGSFDDCQQFLKQALEDKELKAKMTVTTGNSINVARILAQTFYFFYAYTRQNTPNPLVISVPSGNFGHLVSAILASRMGVPVARFIATTNINDEIPLFLRSGIFRPIASRRSVAVSMDVGNPSNFERLIALYEGNLEKMRHDILGISLSDQEILETIGSVYKKNGYLLDPHSAASWKGLIDYEEIEKHTCSGLCLATAHPAKFQEALEPILGHLIPLPSSLQEAWKKNSNKIPLAASYEAVKDFLKIL